MNDLDLIRGFQARVGEPHLERVEAAWANVLRGLDSEPSHRPDRGARAGRRSAIAVGIAATAVVIAVALPWLLPGGLPGGPGSAEAARVLRRIGMVAAEQPPQAPPRPGQYVYTKSRDAQTSLYVAGRGLANFLFTVPTTREAWKGPDGSGRILTTVGEVSFPSSEDRAAWIAAGSPDLGSRPEINEVFEPGGLQFLDLTDLPTDPHALQAVIEEREIVGGPPGDWETFVIVGDLLRETYAPPALRRALYEVAANLSGVEYLGETRDAAGRPGIAVAHTHNGIRREMIFDPQTAGLLGEREVVVEPDQVGLEVDRDSHDPGTILFGAGEPETVIYGRVFLEAGVVESKDARP
jgi:hypothetical protein